jgi:CheY-like chemotaxis protein
MRIAIVDDSPARAAVIREGLAASGMAETLVLSAIRSATNLKNCSLCHGRSRGLLRCLLTAAMMHQWKRRLMPACRPMLLTD